MPDVSTMQQALNLSTPSDRAYNGAMTSTSHPLNGTFTPRFGIQTTLSRSQSQGVQFLNSGVSSLFDCPATTPSYYQTSFLELYPTKAISSRQPLKTPVMHPNLVCTLKSILSPKIEFDSQAFTSSGDSRCTHSGSSPTPDMTEVQGFQERINSPTVENSSSKAGSSESTPWPNQQVN